MVIGFSSQIDESGRGVFPFLCYNGLTIHHLKLAL